VRTILTVILPGIVHAARPLLEGDDLFPPPALALASGLTIGWFNALTIG